MRIAVLSDVHANLEALEAVLDAVREAGAEQVVCLGDVVGYGPDPAACVAMVRREASAWVQGNHDLAVLPEHRELRRLFRRDAALALELTEHRLDEEALAVLRTLPLRVSGAWGWAAHGSLVDPMEYVFTASAAGVELDRADGLGGGFVGEPPSSSAPTRVVWVGHTHLPMVVHGGSVSASGDHRRRMPRVVSVSYGEPLELTPGGWLINPGSVGQPRDADPRARWALLDTRSRQVILRATEYNYRVTQHKAIAAGLPPTLAQTLGP